MKFMACECLRFKACKSVRLPVYVCVCEAYVLWVCGFLSV